MLSHAGSAALTIAMPINQPHRDRCSKRHDHEDVGPSDEGQPIGHCRLERRHSSGQEGIANLDYEHDEERETYGYCDLEDPFQNARDR